MSRGALWIGAAGLTALGAYALHQRLQRREHAEEEPSPAEPSIAGGKVPLPGTFDPIFEEHGHGLPLAYLRALAKRESNMNPHEAVDPACHCRLVRSPMSMSVGAVLSNSLGFGGATATLGFRRWE